MAKQKQSDYRITAYWDDNNADFVYVLEKDTGSSFKQSEDVAEGDKEWALRQCNHYGIELPKSLQDKPTTPNTMAVTPPMPANPPISVAPIAMSTPTFPPTPGVNK